MTNSNWSGYAGQALRIPGHLLIARSARKRKSPRPERGHQISWVEWLLFRSGVKKRLSPSSILFGSKSSPPVSSANRLSIPVLGFKSRYSFVWGDRRGRAPARKGGGPAPLGDISDHR